MRLFYITTIVLGLITVLATFATAAPTTGTDLMLSDQNVVQLQASPEKREERQERRAERREECQEKRAEVRERLQERREKLQDIREKQQERRENRRNNTEDAS